MAIIKQKVIILKKVIAIKEMLKDPGRWFKGIKKLIKKINMKNSQ